MSTKLLLKDESYALRGAIFEVYKEKGCGFAEAVYQECLETELDLRRIPFIRQPQVNLEYKGRRLKSTFVPDLVCFDSTIVELKAVTELIDSHRAQLQNYLRGAEMSVGLLVNFGHYPGVELERFVMQQGRFARHSKPSANSNVVGI
jgi:GxxExxY protein